MSDKYQALREALAAGPQDGPWMEHGPAKPTLDAPEGGDYCIQDGGTNVIAEVFYRVSEGVGGTRPARATAAYIAAASPDTIAALLAERDAAAADARHLRRLLAIRVGGALLYVDDGEMQCSRDLPPIDFKRDSVIEIERKLFERALNAMRVNDAAMDAAMEAGNE